MNTVQRYFYGVMSIVLITGSFLVCAEKDAPSRKRARHESRSCSPEAKLAQSFSKSVIISSQSNRSEEPDRNVSVADEQRGESVSTVGAIIATVSLEGRSGVASLSRSTSVASDDVAYVPGSVQDWRTMTYKEWLEKYKHENEEF